MADAALRERYARVLERLDAACAAAGRSRSDVTLIAVSKLHPAADVAVLAGAGQVDFGENYVQEALR
ncbi:MAG: YggS family pyridoxal phosphate-dependent enzyme, partial [Desulfovibrio sp.]|nr:YggS family pyridoxal phosphate-dependent enzyme [Desulfovibrio sp.]